MSGGRSCQAWTSSKPFDGAADDRKIKGSLQMLFLHELGLDVLTRWSSVRGQSQPVRRASTAGVEDYQELAKGY